MKKAIFCIVLLTGCGHVPEDDHRGALWETWEIWQTEARYRDGEILDVLNVWREFWIEYDLGDPREQNEPIEIYWVRSQTYNMVDGRAVRGHTSDPNTITVAASDGENPWDVSLMHEITHAIFWGELDDADCPNGDGDHEGPEPDCWHPEHGMAIELTRQHFRDAQTE